MAVVSSEPSESIVVWTTAERCALVRALAQERAGRAWRICGPRAGAVADLANEFGAEPQDDLRQALVNANPRTLLLADAAGVDEESLLFALGRGIDVVTIEPVAAEMQQRLAQPMSEWASASAALGRGAIARGTLESPGTLVHLGQFMATPGWRMARSFLDQGDALQGIALQFLGTQRTGSLFAQLFDAFAVIVHLADVPASIDAALTGPHAARLPENLRLMAGHMHCHARLPNQCTAVIQCSDQYLQGGRGMTLLTAVGRLQINEGDFRLTSGAGAVLAESRFTTADMSRPEAVLGLQWQQYLTAAPAQRDRTNEHDSAALACCLAALLSARTGQPESPGAFLRL